MIRAKNRVSYLNNTLIFSCVVDHFKVQKKGGGGRHRLSELNRKQRR